MTMSPRTPTFAADRYWLLEQLEPHSPVLRSVSAARLASPLSSDELLARVERAIADEPLLGTGLVAEGEETRMVALVAAASALRVLHVDQPLATVLPSRARVELDEPLDLVRGPVLRVVEIVASDASALLAIAHRAITDDAGLSALVSAIAAGRSLRSASCDERAFHVTREGRQLVARARERLSGCAWSLDLPGDHKRREQRSYAADSLRFALSALELERAETLARAARVSTADVFAAAFVDLLGRYARQSELLFGERLASARAARGENVVVVRATRELGASVSAFVRSVAAARARAAEERTLSFEALLAELAPARDPSRSPVFQAAFRHRERAPDELVLAPHALETDLELWLDASHEGAARVQATFAYNSELFAPATIERVRDHWSTLLERMSASPEAPLASLSMLRAHEVEQVVHGFNRVEDHPVRMCLHRRVEQQARARPHARAVTCAARELSYGELNRRANQLAHRLQRAGVARDERVLVCMERSVELIVALLGILKAGGAYVPIEPTNPAERIGFVLADANAKVAITQRAQLDKLAGARAELVLLDELSVLDGEDEGDLDDRAFGGEDPTRALAYVIYTSGSTGKPKGCLLEHRSVVRLFDATQAFFGFDERDVWTMFHSVAFDFSVWEIWGALVYGGRVVIVPHAASRSPDDFQRLCVRERVTVLNQTPSAFRQFIAADARAPSSELALRYVIFGGEALEFESLRPWFTRHGDAKPQLVNMYGITETTVHVTYRPISVADLDGGAASAIGVAIPDLALYVLDEQRQLLPVGVPGEVFVAGPGVARGYLDRPELTAARFLECPFRPGTRMYRSGDLARWLPNGELDYLGRIDQQVKIRGFRIETGEIEAVLRRGGQVHDVAVIARGVGGETVLVAYVVSDVAPAELRAQVRRELPEYMVPAAFVRLSAIPMTGNGKVDRQALPEPREERAGDEAYVAPANQLERAIASVWQEVLGRERVGIEDSFFDLGGNSLRVVAVATKLREQHGIALPVAKLFQYTTIARLVEHLGGSDTGSHLEALRKRAQRARAAHDEPIAIVGMACRFPGAADVETFWRNLREGVESVTRMTRAELDRSLPEAERQDPAYVTARPILEGAELFDAAFFGVAPSEAELIDPQQRVLLEVAWEALEDAGYDPARYPGAIGVWCGEYNVTYYTHNVLTRRDLLERSGSFLAMVSNEKDFIATRIAHRLDLRGPALSVHTACSTALVATVQAFWALRTQQCDMALAGGASIAFPQRQGHVYSEGGMLSADGHCRPFDARATGTMFGDGAGMVVLKRLSDALADGDHIYALIRGVATNNDGAHKPSFSAPSVEGQAQVIALAQAVADVSPDSIDYVEAHGTATPLGDPIEVEALTQAFRAGTDAQQFCALGSVKSNFGHLTAAAGVAGLMKTALALSHELLPKTLHFEQPNPRIDFANSPFFVLDENRGWPRDGKRPRRAGVSSFGVGGTNAHVIVEEAPPRAPTQADGHQLLLLSARSEQALDRAALSLAERLEREPALALADVAYTLAHGRRAFAERRVLVARDRKEAIALLRAPRARPLAARVAKEPRELAFVFPGQGAQHPNMGRHLYESAPVFRAALDRCAQIATPQLGMDLRTALYPASEGDAAALLQETRVTQPALFALGYALSELYASYGIRPQLLIGHSVGEFVAAERAGVMTLEAALGLVVARGRLMQALPRGGMLSVRAAAATLEPRLPAGLALAAINSPQLSVVAGPEAELAAFARVLESEGIAVSRLHTSHAFHSPMMDAAVAPFREHVLRVKLSPPRIPIVSTVTGELLRAAEAQDPDYWAMHLRNTVRFADAVSYAWRDPARVLLEVGPRGTATQLMKQCARDRETQLAIASLDTRTGEGERAALLSALGQLWTHGVAAVPSALFASGARVSLPTYPFERKRYFVEPGSALAASPGELARPAEVASVPLASTLADVHAGTTNMAVGSGAEQLVEEQLRLMAAQLELLAASAGEPS